VRIRTHSKFKTAVLIFPDGFKVDVATARLEYYESPAALPVIEISSSRWTSTAGISPSTPWRSN